MTKATPHYHLYPHCFRATPAEAAERYCPNDGTELLHACSHCHAPITSPYSRFCARCGLDFAKEADGEATRKPASTSERKR